MLTSVDVNFHNGGIVTALVTSVALAGIYLGLLRVVPQPNNRNHPRAILARSLAVTAACLLSPALLASIYKDSTSSRSLPLTEALWLRVTPPFSAILHHACASVRALFVFALLFSGPLVQDGLQRFHETLISIRTSLAKSCSGKSRPAIGNSTSNSKYISSMNSDTQNGSYDPEFDAPEFALILRNVVVAPITEEFVFRGCVTAVMSPQVSGAGRHLLCPLIFAIAHVHHIMSGSLVSIVAIQVIYTWLFGFLASIVMIRTESLIAAIAVHMFCNAIGLPDFGGVASHPQRKIIGLLYVLGLTTFVLVLLYNKIL
eukprot:gene8760-10315_t